MYRIALILAFLPIVLLAALSAWAQQPIPLAQQPFPGVLAATVRPSGVDTFDFEVTVSSPYDTPQRYADAFRVSSPDGTVFGERMLLHDHQHEQPFTRALYGVKISPGLRKVVIQAHDQQFGYGGTSREVTLPGR
ncbi:MAG: hypothetical protein KDJ31_07005 [Candidatus Competibacteraceae bacterium]|nr:hypothetical protein [Candidatus Competibacteraceae bacterium]